LEEETSTVLICQFFFNHNLFYLKFVDIFYLKFLNLKFEKKKNSSFEEIYLSDGVELNMCIFFFTFFKFMFDQVFN
jgi:hypothetical protein